MADHGCAVKWTALATEGEYADPTEWSVVSTVDVATVDYFVA